jgi:hypothetical protein
MVPTTPLLRARLTRLGGARFLVGQELLKLLPQTVGDRGRLVWAVGQKELDEIENVPAAPLVPRYPQLLGCLGGGAEFGPLLIQRPELFDGLRQAAPPGDDFLRHAPLGLPLPAQGRLLLIQLLVARDLFAQGDFLVRIPAVREVAQAGGVEDDDAQGQHAQPKDARRQPEKLGHRRTPGISSSAQHPLHESRKRSSSQLRHGVFACAEETLQKNASAG